MVLINYLCEHVILLFSPLIGAFRESVRSLELSNGLLIEIKKLSNTSWRPVIVEAWAVLGRGT